MYITINIGQRFEIVTELYAGQYREYARTFSQDDFNRFAALSGDDNPIHVDPKFAKQTHFGATVAHGMLLFSTISSCLSDLLGGNYIQIEQELKFPRPTFAGEALVVQLHVTEATAKRIELKTAISRTGGEMVCEGRAVLAPSNHLGNEGRAFSKGEHVETPIAYKGIAIGQKVAATRTFSPADIQEYIDLVGDGHPHFSETGYAQSQGYDNRVVPLPLLGGMFSYLLGTKLPGRGTGWLKQKLSYASPAYLGQPIQAQVEVTRIRPEKDLVNLRTTCTDVGGRILCAGEALVLIRDLEV